MRNRAFSVYSAFGAIGFSLGLVRPGCSTEMSWRWTLLVPAPVALVVLAAGRWLIPRGEPASGRAQVRPSRRVHGDLRVLLLVYTVVSAQQAGWASARTIGSFAPVAAGLGAFVAIERAAATRWCRSDLPSRALRRANIGAVALFGT